MGGACGLGVIWHSPFLSELLLLGTNPSVGEEIPAVEGSPKPNCS